MTRWLSNKREGALTEENLYLAKEVLRKKFVIENNKVTRGFILLCINAICAGAG